MALRNVHQSGERLLTPIEFRNNLNEGLAREAHLGPHPLIAGHAFPYSTAARGILVASERGGGKSVVIDGIMMSSLKGRVGRIKGHRALVHDHKCNSVATMYGLGLSFENGTLKTLNPYDKRGSYWNIADDIKQHSDSVQLAEFLIPDESLGKGDQQLWLERARELLAGVMTAYSYVHRTTGKHWTLRDAIEMVLSIQYGPSQLMAHLALGQSTTGSTIHRLLGQKNDFTSSVLGVTESCLAPLRDVSMLWQSIPVERYVSVNDFLRRPYGYVLLLGSRPKGKRACDTINRAFIAYTARVLLSEYQHLSEVDNPNRTWFILDEGPQLGNIPGLLELLELGRQTGACVVYSFQDVGQIEKCFGASWEGFLGKFETKVLGYLNDRKTQKWASDNIGTHEVTQVIEPDDNQGLYMVADPRLSRPQKNAVVVPLIKPESFANRVLGWIRIAIITTLYGKTLYGIPVSELPSILPTPDMNVANFIER